MGVLEKSIFIVVDTAGWRAQASPTTTPDNGPRTILPDNGPCTTTPDNGSRTITPDNGTSSNSESESGDPEIAMVTSRLLLFVIFTIVTLNSFFTPCNSV